MTSVRRTGGVSLRLCVCAALAVVAFSGCGSDDADGGRSPAALDRELLAAAYRNDVGAARRLIEEGADVNFKDKSQQSAYLIATSEVGDDPRLLELTLANGARVDDKDSYNGTGLIRAAERGYPRIVRRLLEAGIDRDHVNRLGWTALHEAVVLGDGGPAHIATVRALVRGGVDVDVPDGDGRTALEHAQERGFGASPGSSEPGEPAQSPASAIASISSEVSSMRRAPDAVAGDAHGRRSRGG